MFEVVGTYSSLSLIVEDGKPFVVLGNVVGFYNVKKKEIIQLTHWILVAKLTNGRIPLIPSIGQQTPGRRTFRKQTDCRRMVRSSMR